jgi:hypothetical protein
MQDNARVGQTVSSVTMTPEASFVVISIFLQQATST